MSTTVIQVENLSKRYALGQAPERYRSLRETLTRGTKSWLNSARAWMGSSANQVSRSSQEFWALQSVSFDIQQGDRVGIIGRNGAGKSTLLKILSRITEPSSGRIALRGRVASLLEVGTGFHPELTGRENIFLNGAVLGMSRAEIRRKFDQIVAFAEVEKFLDTPVKRYSSGMYVRLAFAVAAHLEPEILIVDEVLAVGDAQFQSKCLGKMRDVAQDGRTVLFVSHNMAALRQLCNTGILLQAGELTFAGTAEQAVSRYLNSGLNSVSAHNQTNPYGIELIEIALQEAQSGHVTRSAIFDRDYVLRLTLQATPALSQCGIVVQIHDAVGTLVSSLCSTEEGIPPFTLQHETEIAFDLPRMPLFPGQYRVSLFVYRSNDPVTYLAAEDALTFEVHAAIVQEAMWAYRADHGVFRLAQAARMRCG